MTTGSSTWSSRQGRKGEGTGGVPFAVRRGCFRSENAAGGHVQLPDDNTGYSKRLSGKAAASERARRTLPRTSSPGTKRERRREPLVISRIRQLNMVIQQGRKGERTAGVPFAVRRGCFRSENAAGGHVQLPDYMKGGSGAYVTSYPSRRSSHAAICSSGKGARFKRASS